MTQHLPHRQPRQRFIPKFPERLCPPLRTWIRLPALDLLVERLGLESEGAEEFGADASWHPIQRRAKVGFPRREHGRESLASSDPMYPGGLGPTLTSARMHGPLSAN